MGFPRRSRLAAGFLGLLIAVPALAQQPAPAVTYPAPCDASKVTKADVDRAHTVFLSGKQYLEESNYDKAISYFNDAYTIDCSIHAMLPIIATAFERKGDKGEAIRALEEYQRRAPQAPDHEVIERRIKNLKDQLAREAPPPPVASSAPASTATAPAALPPAPSSSEQPTPAPVASTAAEGPASTSYATRESHPMSPAPWILAGVGGAVLIGGVAVLATGLADVSSASSSCPSRSRCASDVVSKGNTGRTLVGVGYGVSGGGVALLGAGVIWGIVNLVNNPSIPSGPAAHAMPVVGPGYAGIAVGGTL